MKSNNKTKEVTQCLIVKYLQNQVEKVGENPLLTGTIDKLKEIWKIKNVDHKLGNSYRSIVDYMPEPSENVAIANELKNLGNSAYQYKLYDEALKYYTLAMEFDHANPVLYCNRALIYSIMNKYELAMNDAEYAKELDPHYPTAYIRLSNSLVYSEQINKAIQVLQEGLNNCPGNSKIVYNLELLKKKDIKQVFFANHLDPKLIQPLPPPSTSELNTEEIMNLMKASD